MSTTVYRIEESPNNRAGCKGFSECKNNKVKLMKGEIRFGTLVTIEEHQSWAWRHWGCVTPKILRNLKEQTEGNMDLVDGYDELSEESKSIVKEGIEQGHVGDDVWKGDPSYNRPGMTGYGPRGGKKKQVEADIEDVDEKTAAPPKGGRKRKHEEEAPEPAPAKKSKSKAKGAVKEAVKEAADGVDEKPKKGKGRPRKAKPQSDLEEEEVEAVPEKPVKAKSSRKKAKTAPEPEPEPESEDVEEEPESEPERKTKKAKTAKSKKAAADKDAAPQKKRASRKSK